MDHSLTTAGVLQTFSQEIARHGGTVTDTFNDGTRLFVRSVLPRIEEVRTGDRLKGGVALKATESEISIHPYVFRLVCQNGAIMAHALASRRLTGLLEMDPQEALAEVRAAVAVCCAPEVFTISAEEIRSIPGTRTDFALNLLPLLTHLGGISSTLISRIVQRCFEDGDPTQFGFMNAVTSVARDTADPETRWNLEELGGGIAVAAPAPSPRQPPRSAARANRAALVS